MSNTHTTASPDACVDTLFVGSVGRLANDGADSAIDKRAVTDARWLDGDGVAGDTVADHVHHGGRDRALNHYPAEHYEGWRSRYPGFDDAFVPGVLGENISTHGITEADVRVGDVFTLGEATIQIAQPRQPCWKIGARVGIGGLATAVIKEGRAGWLYRVIEPGHIRAGDTLTCIERAGHGITMAQMWALLTKRQPDADDRAQMRVLTELGALAPEWRKRMSQRARGGRSS
ncbi:MOSC domain-containing protein [Salinisphaera aquimarina]|uniref:MOSC domain-containing protein n=1 Tax=Salinisphaera aquimarina TaxID=2094031 RepID=A0ABV7EQX1_9GAMM